MERRIWSLLPVLACAAFAPQASAASLAGFVPASLMFGAQLPAVRPAPCPAVLAAAPASQPVFSKTAALLGGAPSQLELIQRQQRQAAALAPVAVATAALVPAALAFNCQAAGAPALSLAVAIAPPATGGSPFAAVRPAVPGEFLSSQRLSISRTAFDAQWDRVTRATLGGRKVQGLGLSATAPLVERLKAVNAWANDHVRYAEDQALYGRADYWASPAETLRRGAGDCEDIAILKLQLLAAMGVPRDAMFLTIARDLARRADHAILVVRDGSRFWLLDNATNSLSDATQAQDYRPIFSFSKNGKWLHGYSSGMLAAAQPARMEPPEPAPAPASPPATIAASLLMAPAPAVPVMPPLALTKLAFSAL